MKVLFCTNAFEKVSNGPAKFAHLLLKEAENAGFETRILTEDITFGTPSVYKLELHISKPFKFFGQFIRMWKYHREAMNVRKEFQFDVLVYNNAMIGLLSSVLFKRTVGMINDYTNATNSIIAVFKRKAKLNKRVIFYYIEYITCYLSKCIIVNSEFLKKELQKKYHCKEQLFKVLHKGIENELIKFIRKDTLQKKVPGSILFVKTDFALGGLYTLIESLKDIEREVSLTIIGPALQHHEMLKGILEKAHISYELFDYMPSEKIYEKMQQSEIFCVPSKREAFGVANIEAMAMGCKIVSTNIGGIPEAVGENSFAWLVARDNPIELRAALTEAFGTSIENRMNDIGKHLDGFSSTKVVSKFKEILEECL
ncbi:MAG TPA: glycosyltransferase family 4 protein [Hanamia sp.]|nr:glycosyltransferase family 4 protein [Hanamia sp.]